MYNLNMTHVYVVVHYQGNNIVGDGGWFYSVDEAIAYAKELEEKHGIECDVIDDDLWCCQYFGTRRGPAPLQEIDGGDA